MSFADQLMPLIMLRNEGMRMKPAVDGITDSSINPVYFININAGNRLRDAFGALIKLLLDTPFGYLDSLDLKTRTPHDINKQVIARWVA
jgi:hypothetical protein